MTTRALEGLRVIDLTRVVAGPYATMLLGDMGADVVKIELPGRGDDGRYGYPSVDGVPLAFAALNRNKRGITLDIRKPQGAEILRRLVRDADILIENFSAGTMARWGLGYENLKAENSRLIYAALSGFGQTGPYASRTSYDIIAQAAGGLMGLTGEAGGPPMRGGGALGDFIGGLFAAFGVLCAVHYRERTGRGQLVDVSNMDAILSMIDNWPTFTALTALPPRRVGNRHPFVAPYDCFEAKDGWVVVAVGNSRLFRGLVKAMGREELGQDPRYRSPAARLDRHAEVNELVAQWVAQFTVAEVMAALGPEGANIPCSPVMTVDDLLRDPQVRAREMIVDVEHPKLGKVPVTGVVVKLSDSPGRIDRLGPELGEHNEEVLGGELGLSLEERRNLSAEGVV